MTKLTIKTLLFFAISFMTIDTQAQTPTNIQFQVSFTEPQAHYADVEMTISNLKKDEITVKMPVWAPGSYLVREFSKNVESFAVATADKSPVSFEKTRKNSELLHGENCFLQTFLLYRKLKSNFAIFELRNSI